MLSLRSATFLLAAAMAYPAERPAEQRKFSAEDAGVKHPVPIPEDVMAILRKDDLVRSTAESENAALDKIPSTWFSTSRIALGGAGSEDFIVVAQGPLMGANVVQFWVFLHQTVGFQLALTFPAHDLLVKNTRTNGYRNLETITATATEVTTIRFRFNGNVYQESSEQTKDIN